MRPQMLAWYSTGETDKAILLAICAILGEKKSAVVFGVPCWTRFSLLVYSSISFLADDSVDVFGVF